MGYSYMLSAALEISLLKWTLVRLSNTRNRGRAARNSFRSSSPHPTETHLHNPLPNCPPTFQLTKPLRTPPRILQQSTARSPTSQCSDATAKNPEHNVCEKGLQARQPAARASRKKRGQGEGGRGGERERFHPPKSGRSLPPPPSARIPIANLSISSTIGLPRPEQSNITPKSTVNQPDIVSAAVW